MPFRNGLFILVIVFIAAVFVRFYNYENRITFGPEQAMSLITSGRMITHKFTLLGNQNLQRQTSDGHSLFAGALFNYLLIPLQLLFNYDPLPITIVFTFLNLFSGFVIYKLVKEMLDEKTALFAATLFLFSSWSIYHSMFIWNQNFMFLIGMVSIFLIYRFNKKENLKDIFYLGLASGVGYSVQDLYLITAGVIITYLLWKSTNKMKTLIYFVSGASIPNLPAIIFDLRHNFYHVRTSFQFVLDSLQGDSGASLHYYHFLHFLPLALLLVAIVIRKIFEKNKMIAGFILFAFLYLNLSSPRINLNAPTGMPAELTFKNIQKAVKVIADDEPESFNLAVLVDFDTRGHILRYPLEFIYGKKSNAVIEYPQSSKLYVLAEDNYDFKSSCVWELSTFNKENITKMLEVSKNYSVYKLLK